MKVIRLVFMNLGTFCERAWDESKKFLWWIFAPNAYADLYHDHEALKEGYEELKHTWEVDVDNCEREITRLEKKVKDLQDELNKLKQA